MASLQLTFIAKWLSKSSRVELPELGSHLHVVLSIPLGQVALSLSLFPHLYKRDHNIKATSWGRLNMV